MAEQKIPRVGVGCYVFNEKGQLLLGCRKSEHGVGTWCPPGGHLEVGETPEQAAAREAYEETGISLKKITQVAVTNDIFDSGKHYITFHMRAEHGAGQVSVMEPDKFQEWRWFDLDNLPAPLFFSVENYIRQYGF